MSLVLIILDTPAAGAATDGITTPLPAASRGRTSFSFRPWLSADGRILAFDSDSATLVPGDTNGLRDIFVHEMATGKTTRVSVGSDGAQGTGESVRPSISADGNLVAFHTDSVFDKADTNTARDVYIHDRSTGTTTLVSMGGGGEVGNAGSF